MAASAIVVRGYGSWSTVAKLPTLGYTTAGVVVPTVPGMEYKAQDTRLHYRIPDTRLHAKAPDTRLHQSTEEE